MAMTTPAEQLEATPDPYVARSHESPMVPQIMREIGQLVASKYAAAYADGRIVVMKSHVEKLGELHDSWLNRK